MNFMTEQFEEKVRQLEESRHDLDEKIKQKSRELVRSERLASVGFLAAGVAHEINNPLMAISACAESLQRRIDAVLAAAKSDDIDYVRRYLTMIQEEAFRCKGITERLLGLARKESTESTKTDFVPIITGMLEMLRQQNGFKRKNVTVSVWIRMCCTTFLSLFLPIAAAEAEQDWDCRLRTGSLRNTMDAYRHLAKDPVKVRCSLSNCRSKRRRENVENFSRRGLE